MATVGRKPKPTLQVVREGNPGKRPVKDSVKFSPSDLNEPDWPSVFPGSSADELRCRETAGALWRKLAPTLSRSVGLVGEQQESLVDYCVTWARIEQGERALSLEGMIVMTERGQVKNAWTTILNAYRSHLRSLIGELGLSPSAATRLGGKATDDEDDPFD
ncbi:P27 family phage terminase small subunit [Pseudarthrobacter sp. NIBRBAC000502772]|uniref:P27 family phage terminase small subunit n=1 Tax=Pseudarthrobacter sp. NIBRBAC000502772 TaxID=2590775 RepID=UPI0011309D77|nr:P27 family phage terminase small subunit [Pseudarthrobacter sp. NIBRBAC000502772]QDG65835.1 P27 family phage terminase small subunit [Pseudarthrobacter sp. NIBRBAC000502772]